MLSYLALQGVLSGRGDDQYVIFKNQERHLQTITDFETTRIAVEVNIKHSSVRRAHF